VGTAAGGGAAAADPAPAVRRLAVLPFENLGRPEDAYVADGVADEIRGKLAIVPGMQVIARGSSNAYRDAARAGKDPAAIAAELGVRYLLTGTVRSEPGAPSGRPARVRVAPELVEVVPGSAPVSRWAQSFDADLSDAFAVQADVASRVAAAMDVALGGTARTQLAAVPTRDAVAYDAYLRGRAVLVESEDVKSARRALGFHTRAVTLDPTFAEAWAERGRAAASLYNRGTPSPALAREARDAADRALALAPDRAAGYHALGDFYTTVAKDPARAVEAYAAARRLAPGDADVLSALAYAQQYLGRAEVAVRDFRAAQALDPRSPITARRLTTALLWSRRYAEARAAGDRGLALAPANAPLREARLMVDLAEGDVAAARRVIAASPPGPPRTDLLVFLATYWDLGWVLDDADQRTILALGPDAFDADRGAWGIVMAQLYALRGDSARARAFGDSARLAIGADVRANPDDAQRRVLYGLAAAYAGRAAEAVREAERGMSLQPVGRNAYVGAYVQHQAARAYLLAGRPERAIELLEQLLRMPYYLSPAWLRIDPTFAPLRSHPEFERLVRSPATRPTA
jgi:serine/threonine-protein kinase